MIYAWGDTYGSRADILKPANELTEIVDISRNYVLTSNGKVYKYTAKKISGSLTMDSVQELKTKEVADYQEENEENKPTMKHVVNISEGYDHAIFVTKENTAYTIGANSYGQLGNNSTVASRNYLEEVKVNEGTDINTLENVVEAVAGDRYSVVLNKEGKMYTFGMNANNEQGS